MKLVATVVMHYMFIATTVPLHAQALAPTVTGAVVGPTYYAAAYGVVASPVGSPVDQCGANLNALVAAANATGGSIVFDAGTTFLSTCNFAGSNKLGPNVFLVGRGAEQSNQVTPSPTGTVLKMTYAGTDIAHVECLTQGGQCGAKNLTLRDDATDIAGFLFTSIPVLENVSYWGRYDRGEYPTNGHNLPTNTAVLFGNGLTCANNSDASSTCDYGLDPITLYCRNAKRCAAFGPNANGITATFFGDYTNANVDAGLNAVGGFVEFAGGMGTNPTYGNIVTIITEMKDHDSGKCSFTGAFELVNNAVSNYITYVASDMGDCNYSGYIKDTTSAKNEIHAMVGDGALGRVYDASNNGGNMIFDGPGKSIVVRDLNTPHIGRTVPINDMQMSIGYKIADLPGTATGTIAWTSDSRDGTCNQTVLTLTQVMATITTAVYSYSFYAGPAPTVGMKMSVTGFTMDGNNVTDAMLTAVNLGSQTVTVGLSSQSTETGATAKGIAGGGGAIKVQCFYDSTNWVPIGDGSSPSFNRPALGSATAVTITVGGNPVCAPTTFGALSDGAPVMWDTASNSCANASLTFMVHSGSRTLNVSNLVNGGRYRVKLVQDATGGENLTGGSGCVWKQAGGGGSSFTLTHTASAIDELTFDYDGTNCLAVLNKAYN